MKPKIIIAHHECQFAKSTNKKGVINRFLLKPVNNLRIVTQHVLLTGICEAERDLLCANSMSLHRRGLSRRATLPDRISSSDRAPT